MRARLGYAVAAHLDPDALLIDGSYGRTSPSAASACSTCSASSPQQGRVAGLARDVQRATLPRAIYLERGEVVFSASTGVNLYPRPAALARGRGTAEGAAEAAGRSTTDPCLGRGRRDGRGHWKRRLPAAVRREPVILTGVTIETLEPGAEGELRSGCRARVVVRYRAHAKRERLFWAFRIATADLLVQVTSGILPAESFPENRLEAGEGMLSCILPRLTLTAGTYAMRVVLAEPDGTLLAMSGVEDAPLYFNVTSGASAVDNMHEMSGDLVTLAVESEP
jgi:hypothetical protein